MYEIKNLTDEYKYLKKESNIILKKFNLSTGDAIDICFLYNKNLHNYVDLGLHNEEQYMYYIREFQKDDKKNYTLKLPIDSNDYKYSLIVFYFEKYCIIGRFGVCESEFGETNLYLLNNTKFFDYNEILKIENQEVSKLILSNFCNRKLFD